MVFGKLIYIFQVGLHKRPNMGEKCNKQMTYLTFNFFSLVERYIN